jgi:hypothetical protein
MISTPYSPAAAQISSEEAARRRQSIGFWAGLWLGISIGAAIGTIACAVAA